MATRFADGAASRWWLVHLAWALVIPAAAIVHVAAWAAWLAGVPGLPNPSVLFSADFTAPLFDRTWWLLLIATEAIPIYAYYKESVILRASGSDWVPRAPVWIVLHLALLPVFASPIYVAWRWSKVGLPWWHVRSMLRRGDDPQPAVQD